MRRPALAAGAVLAFVFIAVFLTALPLAAPTAHADSRVWPTGYWGPLLSCTGNYNQVTPESGPLAGKTCNDFCDLLYTGQNIIDFATTIVVFVGAPVMIVFGGILLMVGNPLTGEKESKRSLAKNVIVSAVIGVGITLGAYVILSTFLWLTGNAQGDIQVSWPDIQCTVPPQT